MSTTTDSTISPANDPADERAAGELVRHWRAGRAVLADYGGPVLAITPLTDSVVRIRLAPYGVFAPRRSWAVVHALTNRIRRSTFR